MDNNNITISQLNMIYLWLHYVGLLPMGHAGTYYYPYTYIFQIYKNLLRRLVCIIRRLVVFGRTNNFPVGKLHKMYDADIKKSINFTGKQKTSVN